MPIPPLPPNFDDRSAIDLRSFADKVRIDARSNAVFPHFNREHGLCGFELKNDGFTGFAKGGAKGLWFSSAHRNDRTLVIAESATDALSYAALHGHDFTRFALVQAAIEKLPGDLEQRGHAVLAFDNDCGGDAFVEMATEVFGAAGRGELTLREHRSETAGFDRSDELVAREANSPPPIPRQG